jgi:hypothetical protein
VLSISESARRGMVRQERGKERVKERRKENDIYRRGKDFFFNCQKMVLMIGLK